MDKDSTFTDASVHAEVCFMINFDNFKQSPPTTSKLESFITPSLKKENEGNDYFFGSDYSDDDDDDSGIRVAKFSTFEFFIAFLC